MSENLNNENANVENVKTSEQNENLTINNANSEDRISKNNNPVEVKNEKKANIEEELITFTPKTLSKRLEREKNKTKEEVASQLKKEFEEKLNQTFVEIEKLKEENSTLNVIKENTKIIQELYKNQVDPNLDEDEFDFLINKIKKQKTDDIQYADIIKNLKENKSKYFSDGVIKHNVVIPNSNSITINNDPYQEALEKQKEYNRRMGYN